jgi:hypothetical protein
MKYRPEIPWNFRSAIEKREGALTAKRPRKGAERHQAVLSGSTAITVSAMRPAIFSLRSANGFTEGFDT